VVLPFNEKKEKKMASLTTTANTKTSNGL